jgi:Domain of unknown function (DUF4387)
MRLGDVATVCRTKNAGAFLLTIDVIFDEVELFELARRRLTPELLGELYQVSADAVVVVPWEHLLAIKATVPRWQPAGGPGERDVYGCQQHAPLLDLEL